MGSGGSHARTETFELTNWEQLKYITPTGLSKRGSFKLNAVVGKLNSVFKPAHRKKQL